MDVCLEYFNYHHKLSWCWSLKWSSSNFLTSVIQMIRIIFFRDFLRISLFCYNVCSFCNKVQELKGETRVAKYRLLQKLKILVYFILCISWVTESPHFWLCRNLEDDIQNAVNKPQHKIFKYLLVHAKTAVKGCNFATMVSKALYIFWTQSQSQLSLFVLYFFRENSF